MYKSLKNIAKMYDISISYIKKHHANDLKEGVHFIYVGNMQRFKVSEMEKLLVSHKKPEEKNNPLLDKFLV